MKTKVMPALLRIILINTHMKGIVELKLDGHTNICGTNASGKTTLQRLIPVFYGEYPSRVVPATRDSFERWYLPSDSSFIIYEYQRADGDICHVMLSSTGSGVDYRFAAKGFDLDDYTVVSADGQRHVMTPKDVVRGLKRNGFVCSRVLNTKEFKAVIQNDKSVLSGSRDLLGFARLFSLCEINANLRHIEKLAKAVHSKEGKMETIKAMIAAILEEDGVQPGDTKLSANKVEEWLKEVKLIKGFEDIRPEFAKLQRAHMQFVDNDQRLAQLQQTFDVDTGIVAATICEQQALLSSLQEELSETESLWSDTRDQLNQTLSVAKADQQKLANDLDNIEAQYDSWQERDIEQLSDDLEQLPRWRNELSAAQGKYHLVTEQHQDIEASYLRQKSQLQDQHSEELDGYAENKDALNEKLAEQRAQQQQQLQSTQFKFRQLLNDQALDYQQQLNDLQQRITEVRTLANNQGYSKSEQTQLMVLDVAVKEASQNEDAGRGRLNQLEQLHKQLLIERDKVSKALETQRREVGQQQQQIQAIETLLYPGEGTLLEYLRKNIVEWNHSIGKVIRPEILQRTDLSPSHDAGSSELFGLKIDLQRLDSPEFSQSETELRNQLEQALAQLSELTQTQSELEKQLADANQKVRDSELKITKQQTELNNAELTRKRSQQDRNDLVVEYDAAVQQRKQTYLKQQKQLEQDVSKVTQQRQDAEQELQDQQREAEMELSLHWQQVVSETESQLEQLASRVKACRTSFQQRVGELDSWLQSELAERGIDVDEIGQLKRTIADLSKRVAETEKQAPLVAEYRHWYQTYYLGYKVKWQAMLAEVRQQVSDASRSLEKQQQHYRDKVSAIKSQQLQSEQALKQANEAEQLLKNVAKQLSKISLPTAQLASNNASLSQRLSEGQDLLNQRDDLLADIRAYVEHFDQKIAAQAGTGFYDTWERSRQSCTVINEQGARQLDYVKLVAELDRLVNVLLPQKVSGIREQGRIFGLALSEYYKVLKDVENHIGHQSERISREVDEELFLDGVSDSAVVIRSKISELEFWPELKLFHKLYQRWIDDGADNLPSDEYTQSMRRVIEILGRSALSGGISKLLDIELRIKEGQSQLVIRTDRQLNESSSHGMAYLILCKFLLAFTRLLRGDSKAIIHWPIDELGTLHQSNIKKIFDACQNNLIHVVGAFPNPESEVLSLFVNRYLIDKQKKQLQVVEPKVSVISAALKHKQGKQVTEVQA